MKLHELDSRLSVGITYSAYGESLGDVAVAHESLAWQSDWGGNCLGAADAAGDAFEEYKSAMSLWGACIRDIGCKPTRHRTMSTLRTHWRNAGDLLQKADAYLSQST
jgi:hypothetical protein